MKFTGKQNLITKFIISFIQNNDIFLSIAYIFLNNPRDYDSKLIDFFVLLQKKIKNFLEN